MKLEVIGENRTVVMFKDGTEIFFSYDTPVAGFFPATGYVRTKHNWSKTTSKHITEYLADRGGRAWSEDQSIFDNYIIGM